MAYEANKDKLTKLEALKQLSERVNKDFATKKELKTLEDRVDGLVTAGGEPNKIEIIKVNGKNQTVSPDDKSVNIVVPANVSDLINDENYQTDEDVSAAIDAKISSTYKPGGSYAFINLPEAIVENLGKVYNVTDAFSTTINFLEGAGNTYPAGTNVVVIDAGLEDYKYDVLAGFVDLTNYQTKESGKGLSTEDFTTELKDKLNSLNNYIHPNSEAGAKTTGLYKISTDAQGHIIGAEEVTKSDITNLGIPESDTTYSNATISESGLMSVSDKQKLDNIEIATTEEVKEMLDELFEGVEG